MEASPDSESRSRAAVVPFPGRQPASWAAVRGWLPSGRSLLVGFAVVGVAAAAYAGARSSSVFAIRAIEVEGASPALEAEVRRAVRPVLGESLLTLEAADVVRPVEALPEVVSAVYDRAFPNTLVIVVRRERPVAVLRRGKESWLVSARASVIRSVPHGSLPKLPRVWVPTTVGISAGTVVAYTRARRAIEAVAPLRAEGFPARVGTVRTDERELTLELLSGLEVRLGDEHDVRLKLAVARRILPLLAHPSDGGPTYLDLGVPERPVVGRDSQLEG